MEDYNQFALEYAEKTAEQEIETRNKFYFLLPDLKGKLLLDIGCGSGHDASHYSKKGAIVHGIDISKKEIEMARLRNCGTFRIGDMRKLPYKPNTFDIVTSVYALQASDDVKKTLLEMIRVAKPNALIFVLTKHPFRNLLEGYVNDENYDYYGKRKITSYIFARSIKLQEPGHAMMEYLSPEVLEEAILEDFQEHSDFPASDQVIAKLNYPTFVIFKFRKK